jgi:hypothetical protein
MKQKILCLKETINSKFRKLLICFRPNSLYEQHAHAFTSRLNLYIVRRIQIFNCPPLFYDNRQVSAILGWNCVVRRRTWSRNFVCGIIKMNNNQSINKREIPITTSSAVWLDSPAWFTARHV